MAASSSDESNSAPKDFHLSSLLDSGNRSSLNSNKCSLCCNLRKKFYCKKCVNSGQIQCSKSQTNERYNDKQKALEELEENKKLLERKCLNLLESKRKAGALNTEIKQSEARIKIIKMAMKQKRKELSEQIKVSEETVIVKNSQVYKHKVEETEYCIFDKNEHIESIQQQLKIKQNEIKKIVKIRIEQLCKYIFPITKVEPQSETSSESSDMVSALADACQTIYSKDSWEYTDNPSKLQYSIVAPTLPASGSNSLYHMWASQIGESVPGSNSSFSVEQNPAYNIRAALTYTVQLIHVLAFYLNVRLPYKMMHSDFCVKDLNVKQFNRRIARLNSNVLHLCFTQNIDLNTLSSAETVHNLLQLIDTTNPNLGRQGPIEVDSEKASLLEMPLTKDLKHNEDSDSDDGSDSIHGEWEAVPHMGPEKSAGPANVQTSQMINTQQANSMAGGLVISAVAGLTSVWRGITRR